LQLPRLQYQDSMRNVLGPRAHAKRLQSIDYKRFKMVEAGELEYSGLLKTRKLLIFRPAKNAQYREIAPNWNVSGTRTNLVGTTLTSPVSTIVTQFKEGYRK